MVSSDGLLVSTVSVESGGTGGKEEALMGNKEQYVVHGADGPFLMNKNKWPNLSLPIEQDSLSQGGLGELTQEDNLIMEGGSQTVLELSSATLGKENMILGKETFVGSKILQSMNLGDQKTKSQAAAEDLLD
jgi:hypothetical protein